VTRTETCATAGRGAATSHAWQQRVKWLVYALLFMNFVLYVVQDAESAASVLPAHPSFREWARAYVTSIDLAAWIVLILLFELETYVLSDRVWKGAVKWATQGMRTVCYVAILHTTLTDAGNLRDFQTAQLLPAASTPCDFIDGWSFLRNRGYTQLDADNCDKQGVGPDYFVIAPDPVITDRAGLREGLILAWTDIVENLAWLAIVFFNESLVRIQERGLPDRALLGFSNWAKAALYGLIIAIALYWGSKGEFLYLWDELLWVCGFFAIEKNLLEWRAALIRQRA
jgi:hypothetical protein